MSVYMPKTYNDIKNETVSMHDNTVQAPPSTYTVQAPPMPLDIALEYERECMNTGLQVVITPSFLKHIQAMQWPGDPEFVKDDKKNTPVSKDANIATDNKIVPAVPILHRQFSLNMQRLIMECGDEPALQMTYGTPTVHNGRLFTNMKQCSQQTFKQFSTHAMTLTKHHHVQEYVALVMCLKYVMFACKTLGGKENEKYVSLALLDKSCVTDLARALYYYAMEKAWPAAKAFDVKYVKTAEHLRWLTNLSRNPTIDDCVMHSRVFSNASSVRRGGDLTEYLNVLRVAGDAIAHLKTHVNNNDDALKWLQAIVTARFYHDPSCLKTVNSTKEAADKEIVDNAGWRQWLIENHRADIKMVTPQRAPSNHKNQNGHENHNGHAGAKHHKGNATGHQDHHKVPKGPRLRGG